MPKVSVCIPMYNNAATIRATVESVLSSTFKDLEVIVLDDASKDESVAIVESISDPRLSLQLNESNLGPQGTWTKVTSLTTGEFVKLVCGDDLVSPTCIARQVEALEQHPGAAICAVRRTVVDDTGRVIARRGLSRLKGQVDAKHVIRRIVQSGTNPLGEPAAVMVRGDLLRSNMPWDASLGYMIDVDMWVRVLDHGDLVAIPETLATFRVSTGAWSGRLAAVQRDQAIAFLKRAQSHRPYVSNTDVKLGTAIATGSAIGRRAIYWLLDKRRRA